MVRKILAAAEQQACCSDNQAHCSDELQHLGFPNPSQPIAMRTILASASAPYLNQPNHKSQGKVYYSQSEPTRCSETHTCYSECTQYQRITKSCLLIVVGSNLAVASTHIFHQLNTKP